jgi:hypothetical protein
MRAQRAEQAQNLRSGPDAAESSAMTQNAIATTNAFGLVQPTDGGPPVRPDAAPHPIKVSFDQVLSAMNPLQHVPVVGRLYRAATGDDIPAPLKIMGAGIFGGPLGVLGAAVGELLTTLFTLGPDTSRPAAPAGMSVTGSQAGVQPVTPGSLTNGQYLTLATQQPQWLCPSTPEELALVGDPRRGTSAYKAASNLMYAASGQRSRA